MKCPPLLVTIAIPTCNRAGSYLQQALESVLKQTYPHFEVIVADNASNDETSQVVQSYTDARIRYFRHEENIGANNNFNFCLEQARGEFFLLLPDDDLIDQDFIEVCIDSIGNDTNIGIVRTGMRLIDSSGKVIAEKTNSVKGLSTEDFILAWFKGKTWPYLCNSLFNTRKLLEIGGFKSKCDLFQDVIAEMRVAARSGRIDIEDIKASSRKHPGDRTSAAKVVDWCEDSLELLDVLCQLVTNKKQLIRRSGMKFFSWINYNRAHAVQSVRERIRLYAVVFRMFEYHYSPITFLLYRGLDYCRVLSLIRRANRFVGKLSFV